MTAVSTVSLSFLILTTWAATRATSGLYNLFFHPLAKFPGPRFAAISTWFRTWQEVFLSKSWTDVLGQLHVQYGDVVRVGPNELHFSNPSAYHEIYNNANRWDKDGRLYRCFGEDRSSFGFLTYTEAKQRKDVLAPLFSKRAIIDLQGLVQKNMDRLCKALAANDAAGKSSDMLLALRCFTLDTIMTYCFAQDVKATEAPDFRARMVLAMDASLPGFIVFRNFEPIRKLVFSMPGWLTRLSTPVLEGLVDLQELLGAQVREVVKNPAALDSAPHPIIYHKLLDPGSNKAAGVPSPGSLYEEAQALLFGGADSAGNTTTVGVFHVLKNADVLSRLKEELVDAWPNPGSFPSLDELEKLSYLTAVIKESLRVAPGVPCPLPRIVPLGGASICGRFIPAGTVVGMSTIFLQNSVDLFDKPTLFNPERWLRAGSAKLERWLVAFSRGPRACLGQNLAMCELYVAFSTLFRRFDMRLDGTDEKDLAWKECFLPSFSNEHVRAFCKPVHRG